jgi:hypothetical protein
MIKIYETHKRMAYVLVAILLMTAFMLTSDRSTNAPVSTSAATSTLSTDTPDKTRDTSTTETDTISQNEALLYLLEEEKLAHDVYTVLYQTYGSKVFSNILQSEQNHQNKVLTLLLANGISDPRSPEIGVFKNSSLQSLYNSLIAQGMVNMTEAYKVGVAIEKKDIEDIDKQLTSASSYDTISVLNSLKSGSEKHLAAFNRQLGSARTS